MIAPRITILLPSLLIATMAASRRALHEYKQALADAEGSARAQLQLFLVSWGRGK